VLPWLLPLGAASRAQWSAASRTAQRKQTIQKARVTDMVIAQAYPKMGLAYMQQQCGCILLGYWCTLVSQSAEHLVQRVVVHLSHDKNSCSTAWQSRIAAQAQCIV
jgi:hypothetical protein